MDEGFVTIPPGHKVVMVYPHEQPQLGMLESKVLLLEFGTSRDWRSILARLEAGLAAGPMPPTITILQSAVISGLVAGNDLDTFFARLQAARQQGWNAVWVLPNEAAENNEIIVGLKGAGFGVHGSAEGGECFVEVHKTDGTITVGMPGRPL